MRLRIKGASFSDLKGCTEATYEFDSDKVLISGKNGSGKTTVGIGLTIPFTGKDLNRKSNPPIRPDFKDESEPHIELRCELDDKPLTIEMFQKDIRTEKERRDGKPPRDGNKYRINSVDKIYEAFKADMKERGVDLALYERLSSTSYFMNLKEADKRKYVFELASDITDMDVAESLGDEVAAVKTKLAERTLEEIEAKAKQNKKAASARSEALPEQITGLEKSLVDIDVAGIEAKIKELSLTISSKDDELKSITTESRDAINLKIAEIRNRQQDIVQLANRSRMETIYRCQSVWDEVSKAYERQCMTSTSLEDAMEKVNKDLRDCQMKKSELDENFKKYKDAEFPASNGVCKACGQPLPPDKLEESKRSFQDRKENYLNDIAHQSTTFEDEVRRLNGSLNDLAKSLSESKEREKELDAKSEAAMVALNEAKSVPEESGKSNPEYIKLEDEIADLTMRLKDSDEAESRRIVLMEEIQRLRVESNSLQHELAKEEVNKRTRSLIAELQEEQKQTGQNIADAENILYQIGLINRRKNEMLSDSINAKFADFIKFKLFKPLKGEGYQDCCIPMIRNEKGEWKDYTSTANNSLRLRADIALLDGFQRHFDMFIPIVVDNAECLDTESLKSIHANTQLFFLSVTDDDLEVKSI